MYLIYVNHLGSNYKGYNLYEFIFSASKEGVDGEDWDVFPASIGNVTPPNVEMIDKVGVWETKLDLIVISKSDTYCVWDAVDGIIALAYEDVSSYPNYPEDRLVFRFGDTLEDVEATLYSRDIILQFKEIEHED